MVRNIYFLISNTLIYFFLFICINTSNNWASNHWSKGDATRGEIFRFDRVLFFGQVNIYHLFAGLFFLILFFVKAGSNNVRNILGDRNFLKTIFWIYFIPVNILVYFAVYIKHISLVDLGVAPIATFFVYLIVTFYIQDIFLKGKNSKQLVNILTVFEALILYRCCYSIGKYLLGFGTSNPIIGGIRLGAEEDLADFYILLFIIALTRLLFGRNESISYKILHILGIATSSCVAIFSFRRYFWAEFIIAFCMILFFDYRFNKANYNKKAIAICFFIAIIAGALLIANPDSLTENYYLGRLLSSLSLIDSKFESQYGTDMGHIDEIKDGWYNVKRNWLLGMTPFGQDEMQRFETEEWQTGLFIHNAYLHIWLNYGLLGFVLFMFLYLKSLQLGYIVFFKLKNEAGLILMTFMACQIIKNIVWPTAISFMNITIVYIFLISWTLKTKQFGSQLNMNNVRLNTITRI